MKRIIQGLALAALVSVAPAVWSGPLGWGNNGVGSIIPTQSTYADEHAGAVKLYGFPTLPNADVARNFPDMPTYNGQHADASSRLYGFPTLPNADVARNFPNMPTYSDRFAADRDRIAGTER